MGFSKVLFSLDHVRKPFSVDSPYEAKEVQKELEMTSFKYDKLRVTPLSKKIAIIALAVFIGLATLIAPIAIGGMLAIGVGVGISILTSVGAFYVITAMRKNSKLKKIEALYQKGVEQLQKDNLLTDENREALRRAKHPFELALSFGILEKENLLTAENRAQLQKKGHPLPVANRLVMMTKKDYWK